MFFILSKIFLYFIYPLTWVVLLALWCLLTKNVKRKKRLRIVTIAVFWLFSNNILVNKFGQWWDVPPAELPATSHYSCAIVLGGFSAGDRHEQGYFNTAADRFLQGVKLYRQGIVSHILITGGNGNLMPTAYHEAAWTAGQLAAFGLPPEAVLIENESRNTLENGAFTRQLLEEKHLQPPYVLITSAFHMRRSLLVFEQEKLPVVPYPANYLVGRHRLSAMDLLPSSDALNTWPYYVKEVIGYVVYWVKRR